MSPAIKPACPGCARPLEIADAAVTLFGGGPWHLSCADRALALKDAVPAKPPTTPRQGVLDEAGRIIHSDRNSAYGEPEDNLGLIANMWNAYLGSSITPRDVAWLMVLLKIAREKHAPHPDNPVDVAGYAAIAGEVTGRIAA